MKMIGASTGALADVVKPFTAPGTFYGPTLSGLAVMYGATLLGEQHEVGLKSSAGEATSYTDGHGVLTLHGQPQPDRIDRFVRLVAGLVERQIAPDAAIDYAFDLLEAAAL